MAVFPHLATVVLCKQAPKVLTSEHVILPCFFAKWLMFPRFMGPTIIRKFCRPQWISGVHLVVRQLDVIWMNRRSRFVPDLAKGLRRSSNEFPSESCWTSKIWQILCFAARDYQDQDRFWLLGEADVSEWVTVGNMNLKQLAIWSLVGPALHTFPAPVRAKWLRYSILRYSNEPMIQWKSLTSHFAGAFYQSKFWWTWIV